MTYLAYAAEDAASLDVGRLCRNVVTHTIPGATVLGVSALIGAVILLTQPLPASKLAADIGQIETPRVRFPTLGFPQVATHEPALEKALLKAAAALRDQAGLVAAIAPTVTPMRFSSVLFDPTYSFGGITSRFASAKAPVKVASTAPSAGGPQAIPPVLRAPISPMPPSTQNAAPTQAAPSAPRVVAEVIDVDTDIPMPAPRPPELRLPAPAAGPVPAPVRRMAMRQEVEAPAATPAAAPAQPGFFEKLFGSASKPSGPALAYAAPDDGGGLFGAIPRVLGGRAGFDHWTAVYDISAHTVYLPDGTRLEAHSGIGYMQDNPRYVTEHMRGATPPAVYELTERESLFHGVRALRLTPVDGADTYGRGGLLAHTFMLGPNGYSNGCVVFRNYNAFLAAYTRGDIKHLAVVPHLS